MSGVVWSKFYWSDWETDPALRLCSLGAQGLWMRMLCIAAAHDPIGYVAVAGRGLDETSLARLTGCQESEVASLLGELDRNGVFSRDRHGRIYSRRMVDDAKKSAIAKKNGKNGGNPSLCNQKENSGSDKGEDKTPLKAQEPITNSQKEKPSLREGKKKQALRLPDNWSPTPDDVAYAKRQGISDIDIDRQAERFRNYWLAAKDGLKRDWSATWRNWILRFVEERGIVPASTSSIRPSIDWDARLEFVRKRGRWMDEIWGDQRDIPPEYRDQFNAALSHRPAA